MGFCSQTEAEHKVWKQKRYAQRVEWFKRGLTSKGERRTRKMNIRDIKLVFSNSHDFWSSKK